MLLPVEVDVLVEDGVELVDVAYGVMDVVLSVKSTGGKRQFYITRAKRKDRHALIPLYMLHCNPSQNRIGGGG